MNHTDTASGSLVSTNTDQRRFRYLSSPEYPSGYIEFHIPTGNSTTTINLELEYVLPSTISPDDDWKRIVRRPGDFVVKFSLMNSSSESESTKHGRGLRRLTAVLQAAAQTYGMLVLVRSVALTRTALSWQNELVGEHLNTLGDPGETLKAAVTLAACNRLQSEWEQYWQTVTRGGSQQDELSHICCFLKSEPRTTKVISLDESYTVIRQLNLNIYQTYRLDPTGTARECKTIEVRPVEMVTDEGRRVVYNPGAVGQADNRFRLNAS